jgi:hypothetical protein
MNINIKNGNNAFKKGKFEEAIKFYEKCLDLPPNLKTSIAYNIKLSQWRLSNDRGKVNKNSFPSSKIVFGIITTPHTLLIADAISKRLKYHGYSVDIHLEAPASYGYDYYFVLCPQIFESLPPGEKRICFQLEQSVSERWFDQRYLGILENSLLVIDYSLQNIRFLKTKGIGYPMVHYLPLGGVTGLAEKTIVKDIDLLFYGDSLSCPRRQKLIDELKDNFNIEIINNKFGDEIKEKIRRAKVVVNIHYYEDSLLEAPRLMECLSLGTTVVSEYAMDSKDYEIMNECIIYFDEGSTEEMISTVRHAIDNYVKPEKIKKTVEKLENRFNFMLDRLLIASSILPVEKCDDILIDIPLGTDSICLSMPETIDRRDVFMDYNRANNFIFDGIRKNPGWIGCGLSYKILAKSALNCDLENIMIMEDDVLLPQDFDYRTSIIREYLSNTCISWDLFSGLIANLNSETRIINVDDYKGIKFVTIDKMTSTVCNIYNKKFFEKIIKWDPKNEDPTSNTIDRFIENFEGLRVVTTIPFIVGHREEVFSALWNFQNTQYLEMIRESTELLGKKIDQYTTNKSRNQEIL